MTLRFACDIDGVLADLTTSAERWLTRQVGKRIVLTSSYLQPWTFHSEQHPDDHAALKTLIVRAWHEEEVLLGSEPLPGAVDTIRRLQNRGQLALLLTRRDPSLHAVTQRWLQERGFPDVHLHCMDTPGCKSLVAAEYGAAMLIDDSATEAISAAQRSFPVLMPHYDHNAHLDHPLITRIDNVRDVLLHADPPPTKAGLP